MGRAERNKGKVGELEIIRMMRRHGWTDAERTQTGRLQGTCDVAHGPAATVSEVRRRERLNVPRAMREVAAKAAPTETPILFHRPSNCEWMATLPADELLTLLALRERG